MSIENEIGDPHRYDLQDRYLELTRKELPAKARLGGWIVKDDHCFMRIILDQLFQGCWYDHLDRRLVAYKQLNNEKLTQVIALAETLLAGDTEILARWNHESLQWRGKLKTN
ncbi:hypothetical protein [Rubripirellula reticaptiva]|uniref:Uncharacterized protein n=1 Tax=Rubripirellula reticaptiva TaxID=2528013 RepID=A0A5C6EDM5_9BACT|nr:hypothetical protein [Rubripirellula reticaptiva]TWU46585.1 hypothetical protein Poly59_55580 [Rubripirellula reticaptiva]